jgi:hypothetical protein
MSTLQPITCCKAIPGVASHHVAESMIDHMLVTDYYDGPTHGFLQCSGCSSVFHFITLDWSHDHSVRVIALSLLPADSMARLECFFGDVPSRKQWIPTALVRASDSYLDRLETFLSEITRQAERPSIVMAWNVSTNEILAARKVGPLSPDHYVSMFDPDTPEAGARHDWFADLGLKREG